MIKRWIVPPPVEVPKPMGAFVGGHPLVAETLVRRGITTVAEARAFLDPAAYTPAPPSELPGLLAAADRIERAIRQGERICVWGDFDVDGQTSTTLLVATLRDLGADVTFHIPVRATESHGITIPALQQVLDAGARLILTCDTGVAAHEAIAYANERGAEVVVTDHHELTETLPPAHAVVNPHRLEAGHPLATLPGVGVAYKLAQALYHRAGRPEDARQHLDLVALGIVADVAEQVDDARYLLQEGLAVLRATPRLGLQALMRLADINPAHLDEEDIGFGIGPRLNALGRLADANVIVEFFTTKDLTRARILASQLDALNDRRKHLCDQVLNAALAQIEADPDLLKHAALVLAGPWPAGVIGIVASRLVERFGQPALLIATPPEGEEGLGRGSARSIEGCHLTEAIATQADRLEGFGGHAMAAGFGIPPEQIPAFRRGISRAVKTQLGAARPVPSLDVAGWLALEELSMELVADLSRLGPFGAGNPPLVLATRKVRVAGPPRTSRDRRHAWVMVADEAGIESEVVWWQWDEAQLPEGPFDLAYTLRVNEYRGRRSLQIVWEDARKELPAAPVIAAEPERRQVIDYRREPRPQTLLKPLLSQDDVAIWREGPRADELPGAARAELAPASALVVWTVPPGPGELRAAIERVAPAKVYLFAETPGLETPEAFLRHLAGLAKYALRVHGGALRLPALAAAMAQREAIVRHGLSWLAARGAFTLAEIDKTTVQLSPRAPSPDPARAAQLAQTIQAALAEVAAYRRHYLRAPDPSRLLPD